MATRRRAATTPGPGEAPVAAPPPPQPENIGTFVSTTPIGYVRYSNPEHIRRINELIRTGEAYPMTTEFLSSLLVIKVLAPAESADLLVYPAPMVVEFVSRLKNTLTLRYRSERSTDERR